MIVTTGHFQARKIRRMGRQIQGRALPLLLREGYERLEEGIDAQHPATYTTKEVKR
jgi:hypothetical protein